MYSARQWFKTALQRADLSSTRIFWGMVIAGLLLTIGGGMWPVPRRKEAYEMGRALTLLRESESEQTRIYMRLICGCDDPEDWGETGAAPDH
ncbi:MAG: hypothetical protein WA633_19820 [Stellaceae bacterium]